MNLGQFISECADQAGIKHDDSRVTRPALAHWASKSIVNFFTETELCKDETLGFVALGTNAISTSSFIFYDEPQQSPSVISETMTAISPLQSQSEINALIATVPQFITQKTIIYKIERVEYNGLFVNATSQEELDQFVNLWRDKAPVPQPTHWWSTGGKIFFYPRTLSNGIVRIRYVAIPAPTTLVNDVDSLDALPYFNEGFQLRVVPRVVWLIKTRLRNDDAQRYKDEYNENVLKTKLEVADREPARIFTARRASAGVKNITDDIPR